MAEATALLVTFLGGVRGVCMPALGVGVDCSRDTVSLLAKKYLLFALPLNLSSLNS